jgi:Spy/CpxP family protein refolding chaperone
MTKKLGSAALAAVLLIVGVGFAVADAPAAGPQDHEQGRVQRMVQHLGLSEEQQATWKALHEQHKTEMEPIRTEARELRERLRLAMTAETPDPTAVGAATLALKQHHDKVKASEEAFQSGLIATLSGEQKTKFEAFKAANRGGRAQGFHGHHGRKGNAPDQSSSVSRVPMEG